MTLNAKIGQYEVLEELSHGSITSVYKAYQPSLKRNVLIKRLHQKLVNEADIRDRFFREAQVCAKINHPNIVSVYDFSSSKDGTYLILEYVSGNSLAEVLTGQPMALEVAMSITLEILKGLKYAHDKGVIHRDVKPDNLLLSENGLVKVSDFGLAVFEGAATLTQQGMVVGTPAYMSPEQASGKKLERNSDIFSQGIVLFEMLTGVNPYKGESLSACIKKIISNPSPKLSDYRGDLPIQLEKILNKMLEKNSGKRYQDCGEIIDELKLIDLGDEIAPSREIIQDFYHQRENYTKAPVKVTSTISQRQSANRRTRAVIAAGAVIIIIIAGYIIVGSLSQDSAVMSPVSADTTSIPEIQASMADSQLAVKDTVGIVQEPEQQADRADSPPVELAQYETKSSQSANIPKVVDEIPVISGEDISISGGEAITNDDLALNEEPAVTAPGQLVVTCYPWADVFIDDMALGQPPFAEPFSIEAGIHQLFFIRPDYPIVTKTIEIEAGKKLNIEMKLWEYLGVLKVSTINTWAEIWVDGEFKDRTPRAHPLILPLGRHILELRNPDFETYTQEIDFIQGSDEPLVVTVGLNPKEKHNN